MLTELKRLAGDFLTQPLTRGREIRDLLECSPVEFCSAAVELLGGDDSERVQRYLVALLGTSNLLIPCLANPATPLKKAESIAILARRVDPQLPAKMVGFALERTDSEPSEHLERIVGLLTSMSDLAGFRTIMTPLLSHPDARIRSKVAFLTGDGSRNRGSFETRMPANEARVRANAPQAEANDTSQPGVRSIAVDAGNRLSANVLVNLYRQGEASAVAGLYELASRPDPVFRSNALWAMSETADTRFLPLVGRLLTDPNPTVKAAAFSALRKLRGSDNSPQTQAVAVRIQAKPWLEGPTLSIPFGISNGCKPIGGVAPVKVRILVNGEITHRYAVVEQDCSRRISAAFLLPRIADQASERSDSYRNALETCFGQRRLDDTWLLSQYSGFVSRESQPRPECLRVPLDSAQMSQIHALETPADLRKAIETARCLEFTSAFVGICRKLTVAKGNGHVFLMRPEGAQPMDLEGLTEVARTAQVCVHAICGSPEEAVREMCRVTGGFYVVSENIGKALSAFYKGISHRYLATVVPDAPVRLVQVVVRTPEFSGESAVCELNA